MRRLDNIDVRLLRVFVTLVNAGGFADAQIVLNLSQPTLSTHLAELEKRIGARLCYRGRKQFKLTEIGQVTYDAALKLFADLDQFNQRIAAASGGLSGRLRVGCSDGIVTNPRLGLQRALRQFLTRGADVVVDLALATPSELEQALLDGTRDLVIGPLSQKASNLQYEPYEDELHRLYCGRDHPLFSMEDAAIDQAMIDNARLSVRSYRHFDDLYRVGYPRVGASANQMEAQLMLILSGNFMGFLPVDFADSFIHTGQLRAIVPERYAFTSIHVIAYRKADAGHSLVNAFVKAILEGD
ncbi:LysR family transcriptional regulator [Mesorhizobium sp.]|uniref:LysR family transcriptional regulator n=1 Tax=Mesorhizobium sp. TaxID=1871066 RepID=UPI000FE9E5DB|nr:LysR family transcriptional regulator [Mesorhizobium sp.]RWI88907.1 MAG: LysR family transcriptional regulator [Mesorhizobium sp.]